MISSKAPKHFIEALESRIAPARILNVGGPANLDHIDYKDTDPVQDAVIIDTEEVIGTDPIAQALGIGVPGIADTFYVRLSTGDQFRIYTVGNGYQNVSLRVVKGNVIALMTDLNGDGLVDPGEITGLSLGAGASVELNDGLIGDVVANLDEKGTKDTSDDTLSYAAPGGAASLVSTKQKITGFIGGSSITGNIIAGGDISNVRIFGNVNSILAGSAANGTAFDFYPTVAGGEGVVEWTIGDGATDDVKQGIAGASISKVTVDDVVDRIEAGGGGAGAKGGSITTVVLTEDSTGLIIKAGDGGVANAVKKNGGAGGLVKSIYSVGVDDPTANDLIQIIAGAGGDSTVGLGGAGGTASSVFVGYNFIGGRAVPSTVLIQDSVEITAGAGGDGKTGGKGGTLSKLDIHISTPDDLGNPAAAEISVVAGLGGAGGLGGAAGKAGAGGAITDVILRNEQPLTTDLPDILLRAGDGGAATPTSTGGAGGSITKATLRSFDLTVTAGAGSAGKLGGAGGSLSALVVEEGEGINARSADLLAGKGGDSAAGNGAKGGAITNIKAINGDFSLFNAITGDGGTATGTKGKGGVGGNLSLLNVFEGDFDLSTEGTFVLRTGNGGNGPKGGGNGGSIINTVFTAINMNADIAAGNGGAAAGAGALGKGGLGGLLTKLDITTTGFVGGVPTSGQVLGGTGGAGGGTKGAGGAGGGITTVNFSVDGTASLISGTGGDGSGAAPGKGGDIKNTLVFADTGSGEFVAGNGGANGVGAAKGGSITGISTNQLSGLFAAGSIIIKGGDGTHGGAGGSLKFVGFGSTNALLTPTPVGNIDILAGNGSAEGKFAGAGGSISETNGAAASADLANPGPFNTTILAGDVIPVGAPTKSAAGGSIINVEIRRGGNLDGVLLIEAGDANDAAGAAVGAKGGDVKAVAVADLDANNILRAIAAGDGGNAGKKGGLGGSINDVKVLGHDIGVRSGETYGYATMGGLFAGAGGTGTTPGKTGSVTNVTAQMIASIVAGRDAAPLMAQKVAGVYVGTPTDLLRESELDIDVNEAAGDVNFAAYNLGSHATNTFVGGALDPSLIDGNKFRWNDDGDLVYELGEVPIDGLVASVVFDQKTCNFTPEARFTNGALFDFDNKY